jgi:CHAT domain-containing protein/tetratricopeptide (TPR) repeat protein
VKFWRTEKEEGYMPLFEWPKQARNDRLRRLVQDGRGLENEGQFEEALKAYEAALRINPNYPDALYGKGGSLHGLARMANAHAEGSIYFKAGLDLLDDAIACFERLIRIDPAADAYLNLALAYDNRSRISDAEPAYLKAIRIDPDGKDGCDARFNLSLLYFMRAKGLAGRPDLKTVAKQTEDEVLMSQAIELSKEAARIAENIAAVDDTYATNAATIHRRLANWYWKRQESALASKHFDRSLDWDPSNRETQAKAALARGVSLWQSYVANPRSASTRSLEEAIGLLESCKRYFTRQENPDEWANACAHLGRIYFEVQFGDRVGNLEKSIANWQEALAYISVQADPHTYVSWQNQLGIAYKEIAATGRKQYLNNAFECYERALECTGLNKMPYEWAQTHGNIGHALWVRSEGEHTSQDLLRAVEHYEEALKVFTVERHPADWAGTQSNLAIVYGQLHLGDRAENLRRAIRAAESALQVLTLDGNPETWAATHNNLGSALSQLPDGDRADNLRRAIDHHEKSMEFWTEATFPVDWATAQHNIATCLSDMPAKDGQSLLLRAEMHLNNSLRIFTREAFPFQWARGQASLTTLSIQLAGTGHLVAAEQAIEHARLALEVYTRESFPERWAGCQMNLGLALYSVANRQSDRNALEKALEAFRAASEVFSPGTSPFYSGALQNGIGLTLAQMGDAYLEEAKRAYSRALNEWPLANFPVQRTNVLDNLGALLVRAGRHDEALAVHAELFEALRGLRSRALTRTDQSVILSEHANAYDRAIYSAVNLGRYNEALSLSEQSKSSGLVMDLARRSRCPSGVTASEWAWYQEKLAGIQSAEAVYHAASRDPSRQNDFQQLSSSLDLQVKTITEFERSIADRDPEHPLAGKSFSIEALTEAVNRLSCIVVAFRITSEGTFIFLLGPGDQSLKKENTLCLKGINSAFWHNLIWRGSGQQRGWTAGYHLWRAGQIALKEWMNIIDNVLERVSRELLEPVLDKVRSRYPVTRRMVIVPNRELNILPVHALPLGTRDLRLLDEFEIFYAQSLTTFMQCLNRPALRDVRKGRRLLAVDNPDATLKFSRWEIERASACFNQVRVLRNQNATQTSVLSDLDADEFYFSCHGAFDTRDPMVSSLLLEGGSQLKLGDIIRASTRRSPIVVLSACETSLTDVSDNVDEFQGLHTAFLIAGARVVVGSLWSVSEFTTALLLARFHDQLWCGGEAPSAALRTAQTWLRDCSVEEIHTLIEGMQSPTVDVQDVDRAHELADKYAESGAAPFSHPHWWAAFQAVGGPGW